MMKPILNPKKILITPILNLSSLFLYLFPMICFSQGNQDFRVVRSRLNDTYYLCIINNFKFKVDLVLNSNTHRIHGTLAIKNEESSITVGGLNSEIIPFINYDRIMNYNYYIAKSIEPNEVFIIPFRSEVDILDKYLTYILTSNIDSSTLYYYKNYPYYKYDFLNNGIKKGLIVKSYLIKNVYLVNYLFDSIINSRKTLPYSDFKWLLSSNNFYFNLSQRKR